MEGCSFWTFSDIVEESGQRAAPFHGGFGLMTQHGVPKAPYRVFQLLNTLGGRIYDARLAEDTVDVWAVEKREAKAIQILAVNHHSLLHPIGEERIRLRLTGGRCVLAQVQRVDAVHANALAVWREMGEPEYLTRGQLLALEAASQLEREELPFAQEDGETRLGLTLPPMGVALVTVLLA